MEITEWTMYLFTRLDVIYMTAKICLTIGLMACCILVLARCNVADVPEAEADVIRRLTAKFLPKCVLVSVLSALTLLLLPTSKEYAVIKVIPALYNNEVIRQDLNLMHDAAVQYIQGMMPDGSKK